MLSRRFCKENPLCDFLEKCQMNQQIEEAEKLKKLKDDGTILDHEKTVEDLANQNIADAQAEGRRVGCPYLPPIA